MPDLKALIVAGDTAGIAHLLKRHPALANQGIGFDNGNATEAHPLHRLCDAVCHSVITEDEAVKIATLFLENGADIEGFRDGKQLDTPLVAAASLRAEKLGILYVDRGANIHAAGCHGGTALHWAAWVGRDRLIRRLLQAKPIINQRCTTFQSTALLWAVHGYKNGGAANRHHQVDCVQLLLAAGFDRTIPNIEGVPPIGFLDAGDVELLNLLR